MQYDFGRAMIIALPEKDEQIEIGHIINIADKKLDNLIAKRNAYQDLFKTLLHELMTGNTRVNEFEFDGMTKEYV